MGSGSTSPWEYRSVPGSAPRWGPLLATLRWGWHSARQSGLRSPRRWQALERRVGPKNRRCQPAVNIEIRSALATEASELTTIAFAAKRHWGYPESWIELWADELTVDGAYIEEHDVLSATDGTRTLGWCAVSGEPDGCWLDYCWVLPDAAGKGIGRALVHRACRLAADQGSSTLKVVADPNAEGFYRKLGFRRIGDRPSLPEGRRLPVLEARVGTAAERMPRDGTR